MTLMAGGYVDIADFGDTGFISLSADLAAGFTSSTVEASRIGDVVYWQGNVVPSTNWGAANTAMNIFTDLPDEFLPNTSQVWILPTTSLSASVRFRVSMISSGTVTVRCDTATHTGGVYMCMSYRGVPL